MIDIGNYHNLTIIKTCDFGVYLDAGDGDEILLPKKYIPENSKPGDRIDVFIYHDSKGRVIATTEKPFARVGQIAYLSVSSVTKAGAFLEWGLPRGLFVPFREQLTKMVTGQYYAVYIYIDEKSGRITASSRIDKFLKKSSLEFNEGQEVSLIIYKSTPLGFKAIINNTWIGILYKTETFQNLKQGQTIQGFIKKIRDDGKIDLSLQAPGYREVDDLASNILQRLKASDGILNIGDKSSPELIRQQFGVSKRDFKRALGLLYKQKLIAIEDEQISIF